MTEIFKLIGVAFITSVSALLLRMTKPELSFVITVGGIIVMLLFLVDMLQDTLAVFSAIADITGIENGLLKTLLKIVGVGYITEFGAGILQDFGSSSIADKIILAGKVMIFIVSMPIISNLFNLVLELI